MSDFMVLEIGDRDDKNELIKNIIYLLVYVLSFVHQFGWIAFHFCWKENRENYSLFSLGIRFMVQ